MTSSRSMFGVLATERDPGSRLDLLLDIVPFHPRGVQGHGRAASGERRLATAAGLGLTELGALFADGLGVGRCSAMNGGCGVLWVEGGWGWKEEGAMAAMPGNASS